MKLIRKKTKVKNKYTAIVAVICICLATAFYTTIIRPQLSHAEARYMTATITGENGEVDFSPGISDAVVDFRYIKSGSHAADSKIYDAKITLNGLPVTSGQKEVLISLPVGMSWVDDASGDQNLLSQLDTSKGTSGVEKVALDHTSVLGYTFPNSGTRIYYLAEGSKAVTINIKVRADNKVCLGYIDNGIVAKANIGDESEESSVDINVPTGMSTGGLFVTSNPVNYVGAGSTFSLNKNYIRSSRSNYVMSSYYTVERLITKVKFSFHVEGKATIQSTATDEQFVFDDSDAANGNYTITYIPKAVTDGYFVIPYSVSFAEDAVPGETITITATGETSHWQPDGPDLTLQHRNSQTAEYIVLPNDEDVTIGWSTLDPENVGSAHDTTASSPVGSGEGMTGILGYGYVNNRGNADSAPKKIHATFDTTVLGVMMLELPCTPNGTIESIHVKTTSGISKDVTVNATCNGTGVSSAISYADLGIERDDYIQEVDYLMGVIPATTQLQYASSSAGSRALIYIGRRLDESQPGLATMEVFDADDPTKTTGVATITSNVENAGGLSFSSVPTQVKTAGETLSFSYTSYAYGASSGPGYAYGTKTPIIYLRSEVKDAAGNFLPISNIRVTNGPARGNQDITSLFGQIMTVDTETARVYILDGRNVPDGLASISTNTVSLAGKLARDQLDIKFSIETSVATPSQSHDISNLLFIQDPDDNSITSHDTTGDPFGISIAGRGAMVRKATANYYQIQQSASVLTENSGKHISSDAWLTWSEGSNPITIGSVAGSMADMKISLMNNSGVDIAEPVTVYSPIPKKDQDWKSLSYNDRPFEFSTILDGAISNPDSEHFTIAYGRNVTPTDNGDTLDTESAKFTTDTSGWSASDWQDVNCVKITATNIPANQPGNIDTYDFIYRLKVADSDSAVDGQINTWRPLFFQQLINSASDTFAGWYKGSYVSLQLANGIISGEIFIDANENGKKDSEEQTLKEAGWKIDLYDKAASRLVRSVETDANGQYDIVELIANPDSYYMIVTNKHPLGGAGTTYLFAPKGEASNIGTYNTDNQAEGDKTSTPIHATARVTPISPSQTSGEASYNIGVVEYTETAPHSGNITFDDQDNRFDTRPANLTITATASDGSQHTIDVDLSGDGSFTENLPKYTSTGDRLTYTFSAPDLENYNKSEQLDGDTYKITYTQKTATLTVHHYQTGSTTRLASDDISTVYWGQPYGTSQGDVGTDYELDSIDGATSGTIGGDVAVTYYYKKKIGTVTVHYYIKDTTTPIANDATTEYEYGETYTTTPLAQIPTEFENYELVSEHPAKYTGVVGAPNTEVTYFYQRKEAQIQSEVSIVGPDTIDNKLASVPYTINYSAHLDDYIGNTKGTFVVHLPYSINEAESELDGGIYDADNLTITWTTEAQYNSYTDDDISVEHQIELLFDGVKPNDALVTTVEATIELDDKSNDAAETVRTLVRTPATIIFQYVDQNGNKIKEPEEEHGYVGEECTHDAPRIDGYTFSTDGGVVLVFTEGEQVVNYYYIEDIPETPSTTSSPGVPDTSGSGDNKSLPGEANTADFFVWLIYEATSISIALAAFGAIKLSRRKKD